MSGHVILDVLLVIMVLSSMALGWRQGAIAALLSILGVIAGGVIGLELAPMAMDLVDDRLGRMAAGVAVLVGLVVVGHTVGAIAGQSLRNRMRSQMIVGLDSGFGAVVQALTALVVAWMISLPVATSLPGAAGDAIRGSRILATVDELAPDSLAGLPSQIVRRIDDSGVPAAIAPFEQRPVHDDTPADPAVIDQAVVDAASIRRDHIGSAAPMNILDAGIPAFRSSASHRRRPADSGEPRNAMCCSAASRDPASSARRVSRADSTPSWVSAKPGPVSAYVSRAMRAAERPSRPMEPSTVA